MKYLLWMMMVAQFRWLPAQSTEVPTGVRLTPPSNVPATVHERFRQQHPKVTAKWHNIEDTAYAASFKDDSTHLPRVVTYRSSGEILESRARVESGSYPKAIDRHFLRKDPTRNFLVWRLNRPDTFAAYFGIGENDTTWFNATGKVTDAP